MEAITDLRHNRIGRSVDVRRGEAKQPKARANEAVLAAIVRDQAIAVVAAVELDGQALRAIKQVWTSQQLAAGVTDGNLNLWPGKTGKYQEHSQSRFHRRLGLRFGQVNHTAEASYALRSRMIRNIRAQLGDADQPRVKEEIGRDDPFGQRISATDVDHRTQCRRRR